MNKDKMENKSLKEIEKEISNLDKNLLNADCITTRQEAFVLGRISGLITSLDIMRKSFPAEEVVKNFQ